MKYCSKNSWFSRDRNCALWNVEHTLAVAPQSSNALYMRYSHAGSRWWSLAIKSRIMWCALFSRQSRYSNAIHAFMNARQSFWIMRVHQSRAFSIFFLYFSVRYAIVDGDRHGVTGP